MTETDHHRNLENSLNQEELLSYCNNDTERLEEVIKSSGVLSNSDVNSTNNSTAAETSRTSDKIEEGTEIQDASVKESLEKTDLSTENEKADDEWLDITGSGDFKKKILKPGLGSDTRPQRGDMVTADMVFYVNGSQFEEKLNFKFIVGDLDVIQGLDLVSGLMEKGEKAKILIPSKLAYGSVGRLPEVPPNTDIECEIEIKEVEPVEDDSFSIVERLNIGDEKRMRGNYFYERGEYIEAIHCYERAAAVLDAIHNSSGTSTEDSQKVVNMKLKVYNNMAASHLKLSAYSSALKSVELVLKVQPRNVKALFRKAKILGEEGSIDEAIACLKVAASLEPETKVIQTELSKLYSKKKREEQSQKAMYQRMFPQSTPKKSSSLSKVFKWSMITGGFIALAAAMTAYKQFHS